MADSTKSPQPLPSETSALLSDVLRQSKAKNRWDLIAEAEAAAAEPAEPMERWGTPGAARERASTGRTQTTVRSDDATAWVSGAESRDRRSDLAVRRPGRPVAGRTRPKRTPTSQFLHVAGWVMAVGFVVVVSSLVLWLFRDSDAVDTIVAGAQQETPVDEQVAVSSDADDSGEPENAVGAAVVEGQAVNGIDTVDEVVSSTSTTIAPASVVFAADDLELFVYDDGPAPSEGAAWVFAIRLRNDGDLDLRTDEFVINVVDVDGNSVPSAHRFEHDHLPAGSSALASVEVDLATPPAPDTTFAVEIIAGGDVVTTGTLISR